MTSVNNLSAILDNLQQSAEGEKVSMDDVVRAFERRGFGPMILAPALLVALPTGAIPGVPAVCGVLITVVAGQLVIGRKHPWFPKKLRNFSIDRKTLVSAIDKAKPYAKRLDKYVKPRWGFLIEPPMKRIVAFLCVILALAMIVIGVIPFAVFPLAITIALFSLGISAKDGVLVAGGLLLAAITAIILPTLMPE